MAQRPGKERERELEDLQDPAPPEPGGPRASLPDLMRKALAMGFSGFFFTEEVIRKALGETLPRDWADFAVDQSDRARAEFLERLSYEIGRAMENVDYAAVLSQLLEGRTLEVSATIKLSDKDKSGRQGLRFDVKRAEDER
jgi:hypothetical protein